MRPRLKVVYPYYVIDHVIYVQRCGNVLEIEDHDGRVEALLRLLDGHRDISQLHQALVRDYPEITLDDVVEGIEQLDQAWLLEDAAMDVELDDYARERWHRDRGFFESYATLATSKYEFQERVWGAKVALLGVGGVGSHVLLDLLGLGVRDIRIVDFDRIELSNLNRQILYRFEDIGRAKVEVAAERARAYQPKVQLEAIERRLRSAEDVREMVADRDIVIASVDQPKMHIANWVNEGCVAARVPFLAGGVDVQRSFFYVIVPGQTGCVECWRMEAERNPMSATVSNAMRRAEQELEPGQRFGQDFAAFGPLVAVQTACYMTEFVRLVTRIAPPVALGRMVEVPIGDFGLREAESWQRQADCKVCGAVA